MDDRALIMKVSVIIPAHNEAASISRTLEAVLAQTYPDFEVIVVDNASSDGTGDIASRFPVKVVREARKGLLWAREAGRLAAGGEIIANIDADCLPESDWLSRGAAHFGNTSIAAVTGPYDYHDAGTFFRMTSFFVQKYLYRIASTIVQLPLIRQGAMLIGGNNFIRADVMRRAGGYNTALTFYGEDTDTAKRVSRFGRVAFDPQLVMKTSARRFKAEGIISVETKYIYHFFRHNLKPKTGAR